MTHMKQTRTRSRTTLGLLALLGTVSLYAGNTAGASARLAEDGIHPPVAVCFQNEALVGPGVLKFTIDTLKRYQKELRRELQFSCAAANPILITFREHPARQLPQDALGAARRNGDRILPQIEIFRTP